MQNNQKTIQQIIIVLIIVCSFAAAVAMQIVFADDGRVANQPHALSVPSSQGNGITPTGYIKYSCKNKGRYFPYYDQYDSRYADTIYGWWNEQKTIRGTIGKSGCGISCAAMVMRSFPIGINYDPVQLAEMAVSNGFRRPGEGTDPGLFSYLANQHNLKYHDYDYSSRSSNEKNIQWQSILRDLSLCRPVIASMDNHSFAGGGHYIVLLGIGGVIGDQHKIIIADPGPRKVKWAPMNTVRQYLKHAHTIYKY